MARHSERRNSSASAGISHPATQKWPTPATTADVDQNGQGSSEDLLQVGDLARAAGKTVRAIHHYEEVGLLKPHARSKGRYRLYDQAAVTRVRWIGKMHDLGLSLAQIQEVVATWESAPSAPEAMASIRAMYLQKLQETRAQISNLMSLERELLASIDYLDTCDTCDPDELVAACTSCHVRERPRVEPELVAGIYGGCGTIPTLNKDGR
ncbi:MAG TPA: MerR family transcriptional regulator [Polyangium sp.]|nr:MerR family transcriptional regulator [Polyangium sp.]